MYWAQRGADQGYAPAQADLAFLYENGKGVSMNYATAYMWYSVAAAGGDKKSVAQMKSLSQLMLPQQLSDAKTRASAWIAHTEKAALPRAKQPERTASFLPALKGIPDY